MPICICMTFGLVNEDICDDRILQDNSEGNSLHSQALHTLQERLREAEATLSREQDNYRQMQVSKTLHTDNLWSACFSNPVDTVDMLLFSKRLKTRVQNEKSQHG